MSNAKIKTNNNKKVKKIEKINSEIIPKDFNNYLKDFKKELSLAVKVSRDVNRSQDEIQIIDSLTTFIKKNKEIKNKGLLDEKYLVKPKENKKFILGKYYKPAAAVDKIRKSEVKKPESTENIEDIEKLGKAEKIKRNSQLLIKSNNEEALPYYLIKKKRKDKFGKYFEKELEIKMQKELEVGTEKINQYKKLICKENENISNDDRKLKHSSSLPLYKRIDEVIYQRNNEINYLKEVYYNLENVKLEKSRFKNNLLNNTFDEMKFSEWMNNIKERIEKKNLKIEKIREELIIKKNKDVCNSSFISKSKKKNELFNSLEENDIDKNKHFTSRKKKKENKILREVTPSFKPLINLNKSLHSSSMEKMIKPSINELIIEKITKKVKKEIPPVTNIKNKQDSQNRSAENILIEKEPKEHKKKLKKHEFKSIWLKRMLIENNNIDNELDDNYIRKGNLEGNTIVYNSSLYEIFKIVNPEYRKTSNKQTSNKILKSQNSFFSDKK